MAMPITPEAALQTRQDMKKQLEKEYAVFLQLASENAGLALQYFMMELAVTGLDYAGTGLMVFSSEESVMGVLNEDLSNMQTDFNNMLSILQETQGFNPDKTTSEQQQQYSQDADQLASDMHQFYKDLHKYFGPKGPFAGQSSFYNSVIANLNTFTVTATLQIGGHSITKTIGAATYFKYGLFHAKDPQGDALSNALANEIKNAYQASINMNGDGDGGASLKMYSDVFSKEQTLQSQVSAQVTNDMTFYNKEIQSYEGSVAGMYKNDIQQVNYMVQKSAQSA